MVSSGSHPRLCSRSRARAWSAVSKLVALVALLVACGGEPRDLSTAQLARVVEAQQPTLKVCYDAALEKHPYKQEMRLDATIEIAPSGRVASVELEGGGGLPGMADCLRKAIKGWQFPRAKDATETSLPLIFKPEIVPAGPNLEQFEQALKELKHE